MQINLLNTFNEVGKKLHTNKHKGRGSNMILRSQSRTSYQTPPLYTRARYMFLRQITSFVKVCAAFVFGLQTLSIKGSEAQKQRPHELL